MKILYKRFVVIFTILTVLLTGISFWGIIEIVWNRSDSYIRSMLEDTKKYLVEAEEEYWERVELVRVDFVNRSEAIKFILEGNHDSDDMSMQELGRMLGVEEIYVLNTEGIVIQSSKEERLGELFEENDRLSELQLGKDSNQIYPIKAEDGSVEFVEVWYKTGNENFPILVIKCSTKGSSLIGRKNGIMDTLQKIPIEQNSVIIAVNKYTGEVLGITESSLPEYSVNREERVNDALEDLRKMERGKQYLTLALRGISGVIAEEYYKEVLLIGINSELFSFQNIGMGVLRIIIGIVIAFVIIIVYFRTFMSRILFKDIDTIKQETSQLVNGNFEVEFTKCRVPELEDMVSIMRDLRDVYIYNTERMNKLFNTMDTNIAIFEILHKFHTNFFSDNFKTVMGMSEEQQKYYETHIDEFEKMIRKAHANRNDNSIIEFYGKYLEVHLFFEIEVLSGIIIDRTREEIEKKDLSFSLEQEKQISRLDPLTGVLNRSGFKEQVDVYLSQKQEEQGILIVCDLDNFKRINDSLGHPEGDKVLKMFAQALRDEIRTDDLVGRLGGDEFMVFLENVRPEFPIEKKLDSILNHVNETLFPYREFQLSASFGAAKLNRKSGVTDYEILYKKADDALYVAKKLGKNQYYISS